MVVPDYTPGEALLQIGQNSHKAVQIRRFELLRTFINCRKRHKNLVTASDFTQKDDNTFMDDIRYLTKKEMILAYGKDPLIKHRSWQLTRLGYEIYEQAAKLMPGIRDMYKRNAKI
jgi:hypothetical protein